jgi:hypothetical protein
MVESNALIGDAPWWPMQPPRRVKTNQALDV